MAERANLRAVGGLSATDLLQRNADAYTVHISQILDGDLPEIDWLVPGAIPRGSVVFLNGEPETGKSWVAYELAKAVASCGKWMGRGIPLPSPEMVLLLNYDNPTPTLKLRLSKLAFNKDMPVYCHTIGMTKPHVKGLPEMLTLPKNEERLKMLVEHHRPSLVVVDSLRQANRADENNSQEMASMMAIFKSWTTISNATVVILHHTSKNDSASSWKASGRGSGEIIGSSDVIVQVEDGKLIWSKARAWEIGLTKECSFKIVDKFLHDVDKEEDLTPEEISAMQTSVIATTNLPGETEREMEDKIVNAIRFAKRPLSRSEVYMAVKGKESEFKTILRKTLAKNRIVYQRGKLGRVYALPS